MKYKWLTLLGITFFLFTSCQSVKDFFKIGENSKNKQTEAVSSEQSASVDEVLNRLPDANTVSERLAILQEANTVSIAGENKDQTAYIIQNLNAELASLHITVSPDYQHCEFGDSFNIMVTVQSDSGIPVGSVPLNVLLDESTLFDSLETGPDGVFFGEFRCGIASGTGEKQYYFQLALDETAAKVVEGEIPHGDLFLMVDKMSVTAEVKVAEELYSDNIIAMYRSFLDQQLQLNLVVPNTKEKFHVQMEILTSKMNHDYQGYSADISLAFYIAGNDGVVIYDMETDSCHAVGSSAASVVESGVSKLFDAIKQDSSFISDFQNALFKE